ncbi:MAG: glycoside hydrolase family 3 C-terminal domain-containing protein [Treponema sp.]|jgi:beta-glucosidase|nr:glycoside hydrolase family 3 C-terminal domain-containing protein [Treponema sp.]
MNGQFPFFDPSLPLKERVRDLISRLTPEEKAGFIPTHNHAVQRLGIPAFGFGAEGAHGFVNREGHNTTFPQTIGLASGWDRELLRRIGEAAAIEARVFYKTHDNKGGLAIWSPTIDMERDPRWGRTEEGYGEDPFLTGELSSAYVCGAQGDDPFYLRVSCGPKHFFANNNEKGRGNCSCSIPLRCMREYYLAPFKAAIKDAKAISLMTAYNEVNGIPMMLHPMLNDIVKKEWGIEGNIVTDGGDFLQTVNLHHYFETHAETLAAALKNGADSMTDQNEAVIAAVNEALEKKLINEAELDEHLERILSIRFRFGQFDPPGRCPYETIDESDLMNDASRELSREAVRKSAVLLKNECLLPLRPDTTQGIIAVIGPLADTIHLDWYSGIPTYLCTPLDGLRDLYGKERIIYAGCRDLVSFTTEDGRPLVLVDAGNPKGRLLSVGEPDQKPARFYKEDWGWGAQTLTDEESGLLLESPYWRKEPGGSIENEQSVVTASGKSTLTWFSYCIFNLVPQEGGVMLRTFDNRRIAAPEETGPALLHDDPLSCPRELFRMKLERDGFLDAVEAAAKASQVIFVGGNNPMINGRECTDRPGMNLPAKQEELLNRLYAVNQKIALVLISGYPFTCRDIFEKIPAILWMAPGIQETGRGLADIIGGSHSPAGRLPLTWYEDEKQLPSIMEYDIISAGTTYQYFSGDVLRPFGYGLSYSSFAYSQLRIDKTAAGENETVAVSFRLKNTGTIDAEEVPQMYTAVSGSVFRRPIKSLKGFDRLCLCAGEERTVRFDLPVKELAVWDSYHSRFCVEACRCTVLIGASSADIRLTGGFDVQGENPFPRKISGPIYAERFDDYANCFLHEKRGSSISAVFNSADGGWIRFAALDFSSGVSRCSAIVQGVPGGRIEIRMDAPGGALAGTIEVPNTGEICFYELAPHSPRRLPVWALAETAAEKITGVHDLYLVMYGRTGVWRIEFAAVHV